MGIDVPDLDDRTYDDLLERAKKLIPAYSDTWTDFNPHDPGITILELLAWLTETHVYQLDQITDDHRHKYLQLLGDRLGLSQPATATVQFQAPEVAAGTRLSAGTRLAVTDETATRHLFETDEDAVLTDAAVERVFTLTEDELTDHTEANQSVSSFYRPFGREADAGAMLYLGFDTNPFAGGDAMTLALGYHNDNLPAPNPSENGVPPFEPAVDLDWAYRLPGDDWRPLKMRVDGTRSFSRSGVVELVHSSDGEASSVGSEPAAISGDLPWIRCRVRTDGWEIPPQLDGIWPNAVPATNSIDVTDERLRRVDTAKERGESPVLSGQRFAFEHRPVRSATVEVDGVEYTEVPNFDASGPDHRHYVLDREASEVVFGDGSQGRIPASNATVTASYVAGGGAEANVSADAVWQLADDRQLISGTGSSVSVPVRPLGPASGGSDAETVEEAFRRLRRELREPARAVTESDYRRLAVTTPGLRIGRTGVWIDQSPSLVVVVPHAPKDVTAPMPSEPFLDTIRTRLRDRLLITDRVRVREPRYVRIELHVRGAVRPQYAASGYEVAIEDAVTSHLHPLYGNDGTGWPFGRPLSKAELTDVIERVDAVDHVETISITAHGGATTDGGTVRIDETALFTVEECSVSMERARR
ncbi:putative baseplate assembly protein [Natranaeroarchaeum aerophilus]|uniref:Baseplate assembly protein n=1 Tax=Natranaeroarchaeum aerophilus TaxID=2917711 RepID=A0AAE3FLE8_9EURY|nr:putative baseplate assembly protein [Natranaeroarchaeum aerophilus]MCL9812057.1 putative baseplate assembly protein [Natranaeroarchaeum aerophilus]